MRRIILGIAAAVALAAGPALAADTATVQEAPKLPEYPWSFDGPFGHFDGATLRRGFTVYHQVCSACHALSGIAYRNLAGIGLTPAEIGKLASEAEVQDGPNDQGDMFTRPGRPADHIVPPFPNEQAARAANGGAYPPDLTLIVKARKGGPDYVYSLLTGFPDNPPPGVKVGDGLYYNAYFPGHQIAMPPPLSEGAVEYADGTPATVQQMAHDVVTFLTWTASPELEARKRMGIKVLIFLVVLTGLLFALKRQIWSKLH
jgi:cytochrome c1